MNVIVKSVIVPNLPSAKNGKMCEGCVEKRSSFGLPSDRGKRWCSSCAKNHVGAVDVTSKMCEDCAVTRSNFGLPSDRRKRWCSGCAKKQVGVVDVTSRMCEDCVVTWSTFGLPSDRRKRWCSGCAKNHVGVVNVINKMRRDDLLRGRVYKVESICVWLNKRGSTMFLTTSKKSLSIKDYYHTRIYCTSHAHNLFTIRSRTRELGIVTSLWSPQSCN